MNFEYNMKKINHYINKFFKNTWLQINPQNIQGIKVNIFYNNSKIYEAYTGEEDLELDNNDWRNREMLNKEFVKLKIE